MTFIICRYDLYHVYLMQTIDIIYKAINHMKFSALNVFFMGLKVYIILVANK